jgi:hypothetical protein
MRLQQNQTWKQGEQYIRIVKLERKAVEYTILKDILDFGASHAFATKKDFCRLLKGATLMPPSRRIGPLEPDAIAPAAATPPATKPV